MPWKVFPKDDKFCVYKLTPEGEKGEEVACHDTEDSANAQLRALYAKANVVNSRRTRLVVNAYRSVEKSGKTFLVVPGVPLREQVLNNYLVPGDEIARSVVSWNGTPITLDHPKTHNGSVNVPDPDVAIIGHFYNARWEPEHARMAGEYWIDVDEAMKWKEGETIVTNIKAGKILETSTGYYADDEPTVGEFDGRSYETIHRNILNDHIAILTREVGACSVRDGCGVNRNAQLHECDCDCPFKNEDSLDKQLMEVRAAFEKTFVQLSDQAAPSPSYLWIREIFDGYVIVENGTDLFRVNYGRDTEGNPTFAARDQWQTVELQYVATNAEIPDYQADHLPRQMLEGFAFNKGNRTAEQIEGLRSYIKEHGIDKPVTVMRKEDGEIKILDGNHRVAMAGEFDIEQIPVNVFDEQLQPLDAELLYKEWAHGQDQGYLNRESRSSTSTTVSNNQKEPDMKSLKELLDFLQGKGIKVKQNEAGEFEVEDPTTPVQNAAPGAVAESLSAEDVQALKSLAALANSETLESLKSIKVLTNFAKNLETKEQAERQALIASIKANAANVYSDEELESLVTQVLTKLNAQMTMSYAGLGGAQVITNEDDQPLSIQPVLLAGEEE